MAATCTGHSEDKNVTFEHPGWGSKQIGSDGNELPKHSKLLFEAVTDMPYPYDVYWQVVNTGDEARAANGLRGGFDTGTVEFGKLTRKEALRRLEWVNERA